MLEKNKAGFGYAVICRGGTTKEQRDHWSLCSFVVQCSGGIYPCKYCMSFA